MVDRVFPGQSGVHLSAAALSLVSHSGGDHRNGLFSGRGHGRPVVVVAGQMHFLDLGDNVEMTDLGVRYADLRGHLRVLLSQFGVHSNPAFPDEQIVESFAQLLSREQEVHPNAAGEPLVPQPVTLHFHGNLAGHSEIINLPAFVGKNRPLVISHKERIFIRHGRTDTYYEVDLYTHYTNE